MEVKEEVDAQKILGAKKFLVFHQTQIIICACKLCTTMAQSLATSDPSTLWYLLGRYLPSTSGDSAYKSLWILCLS